MKKLLLVFVVVLNLCINAQTISTVSSGSWQNSSTWDCACVPYAVSPNINIVINHNVTMNSSMLISAGSITISTTGKLVDDAAGRDILMKGGTFTNNGVAEFRYLVDSAGTFTNNDTLYLKSLAVYSTFNNNGKMLNIDSLYASGNFTNSGKLDVGTFFNNSTFHNYGNIPSSDSIFNAGVFTNHTGAYLYADSLTNTGTLTNNGTILHTDFTNTGFYTNNNRINFRDFTNLGTFTNNDSLIGSRSFLNTGKFTNENGAKTLITYDFFNGDSLLNDAITTNNGLFTTGHNWFNSDTVKGNLTGQFVVQNESGNSGVMLGYFDFCDMTQISLFAPYIDFNSGTIANTITWCDPSGIKQVSEDPKPEIIQNPVASNLFVMLDSKANFFVSDVTGRIVLRGTTNENININHLPNGFYSIVFENKKSNEYLRFIKQ